MTVSFPSFEWIPNPEQISDSAATILAVASETILRYGTPENQQKYKRQVIEHGVTSLAFRSDRGDTAFQLLVSFDSMQIGKAGAKKYQFDDGDLGSYAFICAQYEVAIWNPWPTAKGGLSAQAAATADRMGAAFNLWRDSYVVWAALRSLSMNGSSGQATGVRTSPGISPIPQDHMLVGPMTPKQPSGGQAGMVFPVEVQF